MIVLEIGELALNQVHELGVWVSVAKPGDLGDKAFFNFDELVDLHLLFDHPAVY